MSEDLTDYLLELGIRVRYLHSEVDTLRRVELLRELRMGEFDVLVGINLLREGLDLPEVSLVSILDADKEGFLRSSTSLIQTIGRAARNVSGQVHMYADRITPSMAQAIDETNRRRDKQVPTTPSAASTRSRCARGSATSPSCIAREDADTEELIGGSGRSQSRGKAPVPGFASRSGEAGRGSSATSQLPRAELADLIQQLNDQMHAAAARAAVRAGRPAARRDLRAQEGAARHGCRRGAMTWGELVAYALAKPGAWADEPWGEGDRVVKVGSKIFAFCGDGHAEPPLGVAALPARRRGGLAGSLPRLDRPCSLPGQAAVEPRARRRVGGRRRPAHPGRRLLRLRGRPADQA